MALITSQKEQPHSGDLFVTKEKWEAYQTTKGQNQEKQNKNSISLENSEEVTQSS